MKALADSDERQRKYAGPYERRSATSGPPETPFAFYEKKLGLKIKDDLLPLLGNELALALPKKAKKTTNDAATSSTVNPPTGESVQQNAAAGPNPLIAIAVKDREAVGRLIPKIIEGLGLKGASLLAQTEKRDGTEIVSYAGVFSYAFVGDFLVLSPDPAETRHVVDAYLNHQTLSSDSHFRNYTRWQPRQVLGQLYMAPGLVAEYTVGSGKSGAALDKMNAFFSGVNPVIDPLTYSLSNDGLGPLHELHLPKNLLQVLVAEMLVGASESVPSSNEAIARGLMQSLANAEATYSMQKCWRSMVTESRDLLLRISFRLLLFPLNMARPESFLFLSTRVRYSAAAIMVAALPQLMINRCKDDFRCQRKNAHRSLR